MIFVSGKEQHHIAQQAWNQCPRFRKSYPTQAHAKQEGGGSITIYLSYPSIAPSLDLCFAIELIEIKDP